MDWFNWLSKTGLDPSLVYEYCLSFSKNELEEGDIPHFNHEFLQSMGISVAKHRLEILKLARKEETPQPVSRILILMRRTKMHFYKLLQRRTTRKEGSTLTLMPKHGHSARWKSITMLKRNKNVMVSQERERKGTPFLLTYQSPLPFRSSRIERFSSPKMNEYHEDNDGGGDDDDDDDEQMENYSDRDEYWSSAVKKEMRWDAMFQNLKAT